MAGMGRKFLERVTGRAGPSVLGRVLHQSSPHGVVQQVPHYGAGVIVFAQNSIVEAGLPQMSVRSAPPRVSYQLLPDADCLAQIGVVSLPFEQQMRVVRHETVRGYSKASA